MIRKKDRLACGGIAIKLEARVDLEEQKCACEMELEKKNNLKKCVLQIN